MLATLPTLSDMPRKPTPEADKKVPIGARVDPHALSALAELARADDRTLSYMIEKAIREYVERHAAKPPRK